ncbi:VWA domain-containing protein [Nitrospira sp. M1]
MEGAITGGLVHFLRPWWFLGFLPLGVMLWLLIRQRVGAQGWEVVCDAHLLPHLLVGNTRISSRSPYILLAIVWSLCLLALAGPVWSKLPQPVFRAQSALVLVVDLSRSMDAQDIQPSRLTRAKHKVLDILKRRQEGQTALVVFSGEPYVVSPLTEDANTIAAMVSSLDTSLMPAVGSRPDLALIQAHDLLEQSGISEGTILLMTDGVDMSDIQPVVKKVRSQQHRVSVLGVGTSTGAPIPQSDGFLKDENGAIVLPKLNSQELMEVARMGQGRYATIRVDDQDLDTVLPSDWTIEKQQADHTTSRTTDVWREEGPWIVLGIVALTIPAFRSGWLGIVFAMLLLTPSPGQAFFGEEWWSRPDQQGAQAMKQHDPQKASTLFEDPSWKGVANYRAGKFEEAVESFSHDDSPDGHFNRGNALARAGKLQEALTAYQAALQQAPTHEDAQHNYELIEKLLKQQDNQQDSDSKGDPSQDNQSSESQQSEEGQAQKSKDQPGQQEGKESSDNAQAGKQSDAGSQEDKDKSSQDMEEQVSQSPSGSSGEQQESTPDIAQQGNSEVDGEEDEKQEPRAGNLTDESTEDLSDGETEQKSMTAAGLSREEKTELESQQATEQWLRRIPDDPGGLLRRKFLLEHRRRQEAGQGQVSGGKTW